jgi:Flp pilus assembly pilin Flp
MIYAILLGVVSGIFIAVCQYIKSKHAEVKLSKAWDSLNETIHSATDSIHSVTEQHKK